MLRSSFALSLAVCCQLAGCTEEVGPCDDAQRGRDTVLAEGKVVYAGQAMINKACATGCHASTARGPERQGAPSGLDFDLEPLSAAEVSATDDGVAELESPPLAALKKRHAAVRAQRDAIWTQVERGLMPPSGLFQQLFTNLFDSDEDEPCTRREALSALSRGEARAVLRGWLACGAPIVEVNAPALAAQAEGSVGDQYPSCEAADASLENLLAVGPLSSCNGCHPGVASPSFASLDAVREGVIDDGDEACDGKPYVTPGDPSQSFLYDLLARGEPGCDVDRMPLGGPYLSESELALVEAWIRAGAP